MPSATGSTRTTPSGSRPTGRKPSEDLDSYSESIGDETSVVRMHSGNGPHEEMDRRAIACFDQALTDSGLEAGDPVRQVLLDYFAWATTTTMDRYHDSEDDVPDGLPIPHWSWNGLVEG